MITRAVVQAVSAAAMSALSFPVPSLSSLLPVSAAAPAATPAPAVTPAASRPIGHVSTARSDVAITFDACATRTNGYGFDRGIFDILRSQDIPATIFVSGRWVEFHPDAMKELIVDPRIEFGDHSYDHPHMTELTDAQVADEIDQTEAVLARYGRHSVAFRPPFGEWDARLVRVVRERGLATVTWDVVSGDPSTRITPGAMVRAVLANARPGSIIIFHINGRGWRTAEALPAILDGLRARGLRFVPLSALLAGPTVRPIEMSMRIDVAPPDATTSASPPAPTVADAPPPGR